MNVLFLERIAHVMNILVEKTAVERGSMVLVTERRRDWGSITCETCGVLHKGGHARGVIVQEHDDADCQWLLWIFSDGFSISDESAKGPIAICSRCQAIPVIRIMRFAEEPIPIALFE
jgi:hypothetical protein